jgi:hypothetical protein
VNRTSMQLMRGISHFNKLHVNFVRAHFFARRLLLNHDKKLLRGHEHEALAAPFPEHGERFPAAGGSAGVSERCAG